MIQIRGGKEIPLIACMLDNCAFSSGMLSRLWIPEFTYEELVDIIAIRKEKMAAVHANYIKGNKLKMQKMFEHGFWLAIPEPGPGVTYFNNSFTISSSSSSSVDKNISSGINEHSSISNAGIDTLEESFKRNGLSSKGRARKLRNRRLSEYYLPTNMTLDFEKLEISNMKWTGKCINYVPR
jgi:hypothetical protein